MSSEMQIASIPATQSGHGPAVAPTAKAAAPTTVRMVAVSGARMSRCSC